MKQKSSYSVYYEARFILKSLIQVSINYKVIALGKDIRFDYSLKALSRNLTRCSLVMSNVLTKVFGGLDRVTIDQ